MKIQLVRPPLDWWYEAPQIAGLISFPIGLLILATAIKTCFGNSIEVEILDGLFLTIEEVLGKINGDWVGVYNIYANHLNALKILETAKNKGAQTVIGGPNANYLAERILQNRPYVDFVVYGDGEEAIIDLVTGNDLILIPNLVYRQGAGIIKTPKKTVVIRSPEKTVIMDTVFDLRSIHNLNQHLSDFKSGMPVPLSSIRGCIKREKTGKCIYCSMDHRLRVMEPKLVWEQIGLLKNSYGFKHFFETGDCFKIGNFPEKLLAARPKNLQDTSFRIYVSPEDAKDPEFVETLRQLNVSEVFLGVESTNDKILSGAGKKCTGRDIVNAIEELKKFSNLHIPFMFGLPGETEITAQENFDFARGLVENHGPNKIRITSHFPIPLPGSQLFEIVKKDARIKAEYSGDLEKDDFFDWRELIKLHVKYHCPVDFEVLEQYVIKTLQLIPGQSTSFGINKAPIL